jgi:D-3-phosphoglycerate dehydrogenase / 2-oxoglutarate reductase
MKIFVALSSFAKDGDQPLLALKNSGLEFSVNMTGKRLGKAELISAMKDYDGVVAGLEQYDADVLAALPNLKCISRCGVGIDNVDVAEAKSRGVAVYNTPQVVIQPVAELTLALIFDVMRNITTQALSMRQKKWERLTGSQLAGKTAGIIGLGRIGRRVAELLKRLDVHVLGYDIAPDPVWAEAKGIELRPFHDVLKASDIVTLHVLGGAFCMGKDEFQKMKKGAVLINTARGSVVDEDALVANLTSGHLGGAALDVYGQEPYTGPLCDLPNVVLTPHIATQTQESRAAMEMEAVENLIGFLKKGKK